MREKKNFFVTLCMCTCVMGCADYSMDVAAEYGAMDGSDYRSIRVDITPSDASNNLMPQSFWVDAEDDWQNLSFALQDSTVIAGNIQGYTIYPYATDVLVPGAQVPVEAQVQLIRPNSISGNVVNSSEQGDFSVEIPRGDGYQLSITPLSPQNVPYLIVDALDFTINSESLQIDLGAGVPVYGVVADFDPSLSATAQLIDVYTGVKGPQIDIEDNGYFQLRAPENRNELIVRIQGSDTQVLPVLDIPIHLQEGSQEGMRVDVDMGDLTTSTLSGRLMYTDTNSNVVAFSDRAIIRLESTELFFAEGTVFVETNNDWNGYFNINLLAGNYKLTVIPPYTEDARISPISMEITVDQSRENLDDIVLASPQHLSGVVVSADGIPSAGVTIHCKDVNFGQNSYSTISDETGRFDIQLPPVLMNVSLIPASSNAAISNFSLDVRNASTELVWNLQSGQKISGVASYQDQMVPFALVEIYQNDKLLANGLTGPDGGFSMQILVEE